MSAAGDDATGTRSFVAALAAHSLSLAGSRMTQFALGVWVYTQRGSVATFALVSVLSSLPGTLAAPLLGAIVDTRGRRAVMVVGSWGLALSMAPLAVAAYRGRLDVGLIAGCLAAGSVCAAAVANAFQASIGSLVARSNLGRASGALQAGQALARIAAPLGAASVLAAAGPTAIVLVDVATSALAAIVLHVVIAAMPRDAARRAEPWRRVMMAGVRYLADRPDLRGLLVLQAGLYLALGAATALFTPLVLRVASVATLGAVLSLGGLGMVLGAGAMAAWKGPRRRVAALAGASFAQGLALLAGGIHPTITVATVAVFVYMTLFPIGEALGQTLWLASVPAEMQGRVFALKTLAAWVAHPLAYLAAGEAADAVVASRAGASVAPLLVVIGSLVAILAAAMLARGSLRALDRGAAVDDQEARRTT